MKKAPKLRFKEFSGDWESNKVASVFDRVSKKVDVMENEYYEQIGIRSHGKGIFYKEAVSGKEIGNKRVFWVEPDVFVVNIVFAWEQAIAKTTQNEVGMIASHRFPMYKPKKNILDLDYITQLFKTPKGKFLLGLASPGGAGRNKTLGQKEFDDLDIILPSYEEQKKIAYFISLIDKKIIKQGEKVNALKDYKKGMMQKVFSRELRFKDIDGKDYPEWKENNLNKLGDTYTGLSGKTKENFGIGNSKYVIYKNVFGNAIAREEEVELVEINYGENQNKVIKGDILFTTSSETPGDIGMSSCWNYDTNDLYLNSFCFGYRLFDLDRYSPVFMTYLLRSEEYRKKISILAQGSTRYNLSKTEFMKMSVYVPDIEEQRKIESFLVTLEGKIEKEQEKLDFLNEYKKGLLQQMFV